MNNGLVALNHTLIILLWLAVGVCQTIGIIASVETYAKVPPQERWLIRSIFIGCGGGLIATFIMVYTLLAT